MARSRGRTVKLPHPLWDGLQTKIEGGSDYETVNAYIRGLVRYSFFAPQKHHVTAEMEKWGDRDQDLIDDLCEELARNPEVHVCGQFLENVCGRIAREAGTTDPAEITRRTPQAILAIAREFKDTGKLPGFLTTP